MLTIHTAAATVTLTMPDTYGWVLMAGAVLALELLLIGFGLAFGARFNYFGRDFMEKHFGDEHREAFGSSPALSGYPDMGCGRYSDKLSYKEWYNYNNIQRVHQNFVEMASPMFVGLFVAGIYYPGIAAILGGIVIVARLVYTIGYIIGGPNLRIFGALFNHLSIFILLGYAIASSLHFLKGQAP